MSEAWELFQKKVGPNTLGRHPDIPNLAREVAKKCHGLPLALDVIGETMASKTSVSEWKHALGVFTSPSAIHIEGMDAEILQVLKYSYDSLTGDAKSCFEYCALFPAAYRMSKVDLIEYWICEKFIDENGSRQTAVDRGYEIIHKLVPTSLLMEEDDYEQYVKMHSMVREMAIWVASDRGRDKERCIVKTNDVGLREIPPEVRNWRNVKRMSLMKTSIEKLSGSPECSRLTTLLLQQNRNLVDIRGDFFKHMPKIVVLNLSFNNLKEVPKQLSELISLRYLNLSSTEIEKLPDGLHKLKNLIHLNLERTSRLTSIAGISKVPSLRVLRLRSSKCLVDLSTVKELKCLENLEILTIDVSSSSALEELLRYHKLASCVQRLPTEAFRKLVLSTMGGLIDLTIRNCSMLKVDVKKSSVSRSRRFASFPCLSTVYISRCNGRKDLTWLFFAPNLTELELQNLTLLEEIVKKEEVVGIVTAEPGLRGITPFSKLEKLYLADLPMVRKIYWSPLPFPCLKSIEVRRCPKLRKLPLDSTSCDSSGMGPSNGSVWYGWSRQNHPSHACQQ